MKKIIITIILLAIIIGSFLLMRKTNSRFCFTGVFIADRPLSGDIARFKRDYGKNPHYVMVFVDWGNFIEKDVFDSIYSAL